MPVYLVTREEADKQHSLMHYRTPGSKNGIRRYQDKNGDYTAAGYQHYKEMYGWGDRKAAKGDSTGDKSGGSAKPAGGGKTRQAVTTAPKQNPVNPMAANRQNGPTQLSSEQRATLKLKNDLLNTMKKFGLAPSGMKSLPEGSVKIDKIDTKGLDGITDLHIRDSLYGLGRIIDENFEDHSYTSTINLGAGVNGVARIKRTNDGIEIASYAQEGLIKQDLAGRTSRKVAEAINDMVAEAEAERIVDSNRFVEGSKAFRENIEFEKKFEKFDKLNKAEQNKIGNEVVKRINEDHGKINTKESDLSDLDNEKMQDIKYEYGKYSSWLYDRIHEKSGNWNTGESVSPAHKAAMKALNAGYEKSVDREEEIKKQINYQSIPYNLKRNTSILGAIKAAKQEKVREQEYQRLQQALKNDTLYQALAANNHKNERALVQAVLRDIGLSNTPENRAMIDWYVFND